jgi:hypothetical protein
MTLNTIRNVADLPEKDRESIEHLVGQSLANNQEVFVMVYTPGTRPAELTRAQACDSLMKNIDELRADMLRRGVTAVEIDAAIEEAMAEVRKRPS